MNDYIILTSNNEWINSIQNVSEKELEKIMKRMRRNFPEPEEIFAYKINDLIKPERTL